MMSLPGKCMFGFSNLSGKGGREREGGGGEGR